MPTVSALVARALAPHIDAVFGLMGNGNAYFLDALERSTDLVFTAVRHEAGAVVAADAHYRASGRLAAATTTYGAGFTNTLTALAEAVQARIPLVLVVGDEPTSGRRPWDVDQIALASGIGARTYTVGRTDAVATTVIALEHALSYRTPVVLAIPYDVAAAEAAPAPVDPPLRLPAPAAPTGAFAERMLDEIVDALARAQHPLLLAGRGAWLAGAGPALGDLADAVGALTVTTALGRGLFPRAEYDLGVAGGFGAPEAMEIVRDADVAVVFGASLNAFTMRFGELFAPGARIFQIDVAPAATHAHVSGFVRADARLAAEQLLARFASRPSPRPSSRPSSRPSDSPTPGRENGRSQPAEAAESATWTEEAAPAERMPAPASVLERAPHAPGRENGRSQRSEAAESATLTDGTTPSPGRENGRSQPAEAAESATWTDREEEGDEDGQDERARVTGAARVAEVARWRTAAEVARARTQEVGDEFAADGRLDPRAAAQRIGTLLPSDRVVVSDGGHFIGWANMFWPVTSPDRTMMIGTAFQSIGLGWPSVVGAARARPESTIVLTSGDGGGLMALADLESAVRTAGGRGCAVIWNDAAYGAEINLYGLKGLTEGPMRVGEVDFAALAAAVGAEGVVVRSLADLDRLAQWAREDAGARRFLVLDVRISPHVIAPYQREIIRANS